MNQFYVSIIFLGIVLIVFSLIWIAYDRKKSFDYDTHMENKKNEMLEIINDAEQMITELNKFSDYVVTQMDLKNEELSASLKHIEEKVRAVNAKVYEKEEIKHVQKEKVVNGGNMNVQYAVEHSYGAASELVLDSMPMAVAAYAQSAKVGVKNRERAVSTGKNMLSDKVIPINSKHKEVLGLARYGLDNAEIARRLSMGKGEIQLILNMNK